MVVKREGKRTVLEAAEQRIINTFRNGRKVYVSFSGGKDSLCLLDLTLKLAAEGKINPSLMIVEFIDEEAIYSCTERTVHEWRKKTLLSGGKFNWFCLEVKHFSCFNQLEQDESFICWDSTRKDVWIRKPPTFAITEHHLLKRRINTYQEFLIRHNSDGVCITGIRIAESLQRAKNVLRTFSAKVGLARGNVAWPIYDWKDTDVWRYLHERKIDIPDAYLYMYQTGSSLKDLRISQFFSIDSAKSLVKMNEYYPYLMDRIIRREPNAYLAALYWDSEMFRRSTKTRKELEEKKDYKAEVFKMLGAPQKYFPTEGSRENAKKITLLILKYGSCITGEKTYRNIYDCLIGGDPKRRTLRGLITSINADYSKATKKEKHHGK
ncbi:MAG: phosphoadenosine phosphosulfate reductase family protein [Treponema sp.]|jgi:predicted phosphoadenosine phosphosulfate sulfurtransferase|nr:phosphoadenosine phosphosulfate reductase family protein [Treponema sp.]